MTQTAIASLSDLTGPDRAAAGAALTHQRRCGGTVFVLVGAGWLCERCDADHAEMVANHAATGAVVLRLSAHAAR